MGTLARKTPNPLTHLHRPETSYALDWEVLDAPPAPRRFEDREPLAALRRAWETDEL